MWTTVRTLIASFQIGLAAGYVLWVTLPGHARTDTGLALWVLALALCAVVSEGARRRGHDGELSSVARLTGLLMFSVALGLFVVTIGIEAMVPSFDF